MRFSHAPKAAPTSSRGILRASTKWSKSAKSLPAWHGPGQTASAARSVLFGVLMGSTVTPGPAGRAMVSG